MEASEDCLYLNVFTPAKYADQQVARRAAMKENNGTVDAAKAPLAPVMVYFPAGQFMWGSGNDAENFNAPQTSAGAEVVVCGSHPTLLIAFIPMHMLQRSG